VWGEHVHHGLWTSGSETPEEAAVAMARYVADAAGVSAGSSVVDVGCGYGAVARLLARERGASVVGLTLSAAQAAAGQAASPHGSSPAAGHAASPHGSSPAPGHAASPHGSSPAPGHAASPHGSSLAAEHAASPQDSSLAAEHAASPQDASPSAATSPRAPFPEAGASRGAASAPGVSLLVRDWLANGLDDAAFDAAIAIESLSHMPDKPRVFAELGRVVRPGGRVVIVDWLTRESPGPLETRLLLRPICEEGHLPSMHSMGEYAALLRSSGFAVDRAEDLTARAARTWSVVIARLVPLVARDRRLLGALLRSGEARFGLSLLRIPLAYRLGSMRLGLLVAQRVRR